SGVGAIEGVGTRGGAAVTQREQASTTTILAEERDSCGIGFVADLQGRRRHHTLALALEALGNLRHRGAVGSDGATGDGAGVLTQVPQALFREELAALGVSLPATEPLAAGVFFFAQRGEARRRAQQEVQRQLERADLRLLAWRVVPTRRAVLGEDARCSCPLVLQALVALPPGLDEGARERRLYLTRRRIERHAPAGVYVASLSQRTVVYKAMCRAHQLADFYPDLRDPG